MVVQHGVAEPESRQLARILRAQIESGELPPGAQLPSIVKLASEYKVATATVYKAIRILKTDGLVIGVPGHGTFVREEACS
jgi:DNA-binding GntR family transcriptional regulator